MKRKTKKEGEKREVLQTQRIRLKRGGAAPEFSGPSLLLLVTRSP